MAVSSSGSIRQATHTTAKSTRSPSHRVRRVCRRWNSLIRAAGDYTSNLDQLKPGQRVFVDGPHGAFTLTGRKATGVALIAGGCGIAATLGILRQTRDMGDSRPVRLVYGNRVAEQFVFQDEIEAMGEQLADFKQVLVLEEPEQGSTAYCGQLDSTILEKNVRQRRPVAMDLLCLWLAGNGRGGRQDATSHGHSQTSRFSTSN